MPLEMPLKASADRVPPAVQYVGLYNLFASVFYEALKAPVLMEKQNKQEGREEQADGQLSSSMASICQTAMRSFYEK